MKSAVNQSATCPHIHQLAKIEEEEEKEE